MKASAASGVPEPGGTTPSDWLGQHGAYWQDAAQRMLLFLEAMKERSARYEEHAAKEVPHVLKFGCELVMDGRKLPRPVNYVLARVLPPTGCRLDGKKRPFVIVDPRAGHGPGIGGFKAESEVGVAFNAGHPCYFIGFLPEPVPGQTIPDIVEAEAAFLERVISLHADADGKPAVVGNCQAGWAIMMVAATRPDLFGPIILAGSPLSYWAGVRGKNPMRYTAGMLGGTWLTAMLSDLSNGRFDGGWLVSNFESLNPANTLWAKQYNLYSKIDTEAPRYHEFEQWWGGHILLNAEEIQFIVDELFVGNKLATGELALDGTRIDFREIRSPIVVFCSKGDDITPPQQALDWILDLYGSVEDIQAHGQTIVYAVHPSAGHLGIFVSGSVARKEHDEFATSIDLIDVLPPGLYEAVMTPKDSASDLIAGDYVVRFEMRTLDDIRAMGVNSEEDERKFATVARMSEINLGLYRTLVQPWLRLWCNESSAEILRRLHPARLPYELFSPKNPFWPFLDAVAHAARRERQPVPNDNICWQAQEAFADWMEISLDGYREFRDRVLEETFHAVYGSPLLQALVGMKARDGKPRRQPGQSASHKAFVAGRIRDLRQSLDRGGAREAALRALIYIRMPDRAFDERSFALLRKLRDEVGHGLDLSEFKHIVREQFFTLWLDERRAVEAIPDMLASDPDRAVQMIDKVRKVVEAIGLRSPQAQSRFAEVQALLQPLGAASDVGGGRARHAQPQQAGHRRHAANRQR